MCALKSKKKLNVSIFYLVAIILGIYSGLSDVSFLQNTGQIIADVFIRIFKCISLPIIALSLIVTLSQYKTDGGMGAIWQRTLLYTISTTLCAAAIACTLYGLIKPENVGTVAKIVTVSDSVSTTSYLGHLSNVVPSNIFSPFLEHQVMGVLLVGMVIGIAIRFIPNRESRHVVGSFFKGAHGVFLVITGWIVKIIPIGLYGFIATTVLQLRGGMDIRGIGAYLSIVVLANLVQGLVVLPLWLFANNIKPFKVMRGMFPALSIAFFSKSSAGTLPVTMEAAEKNLGIDPKVSRFVLPLCTTINMNGCAAFIFATVIYLMQNHGIEITVPMMLVWVLIATIVAVGNAGVPMGCFFLSASLLASMDVPITLLGLILPFYSIIDMLETALNVWSDSCVVKVVDQKASREVAVEGSH